MSSLSAANALWVQYILDNYATVAEAVTNIDHVRITSPTFRGIHLGVHHAIEDSTSDCAIIEPLDGKLVVHHEPEFTVMANPHPGPATREPRPLPAIPRPATTRRHHLARPIRTISVLSALSFRTAERRGISGRRLRTYCQCFRPFSAPYSTGDVYPTWWRAAADLTNRICYFGFTRSPNISWLSLDDLVDDTDVRKIDPRELTLMGDQTAYLTPATLLY